VLFPTLSRLASRQDIPAFKSTVNTGLRQIAFLLIPASVFTAVLAEPIVRLVYQRGEFTAEQTPVVAGALAAFAIGLTFNGFMLMLNRGFFSLQAPWLPTYVALANLALNAVLDAAFFSLGVWGLPLATAIVNIAGTIALLVLLRRRLGGLELRASGIAITKVVVASVPVAIVSFGLWWALDDALGRSFLAQLVSVSAAIVAGAAVYLIACRALRVQELRALLSLRGRFRSA
jgi:putative peptidoglycan lipid II flippase